MIKKDLKIWYSDFWESFDPNSNNNYFTKLLSTKFNVTIDPLNPDIIFYSTYSHNFRTLECKKKIFWTNQDIAPYGEYNLAFSYKYEEDSNHLRLPYYSYISYENNDLNKLHPTKNKERRLNFCSFFSDDINESYGTKYEFEFAKKLARYKKILSSGNAEKNTKYSDLDQLISGLSQRDRKLKYFEKERSKFIIVFENSSKVGYTSNKIYDAMISGAIPIYWGNSEIKIDFNEESFINIHMFPTMDNVIDYVKFLDKYQNRYNKILDEPYLKGDSNLYYFNHNRILDKIQELIETKENYYVNIDKQETTIINQPNIVSDSITKNIDIKTFKNQITPNDYFDDIYCLNLNRRPDRWLSVFNKFKREEIFVTRVEGIDGKTPEIKREWDKIYKKTFDRAYNQNSYAIKLGHQKIFKNAIDRNLNQILILEDDILFHKDFKNLFNQSVRNLPQNWEVWYLGYTTQKDHQDIVINDLFKKASGADGMFAIAFKVDFLKRNLQKISNTQNAIDLILRYDYQPNSNNMYMSSIQIIGHQGGYSDNFEQNLYANCDSNIYI